MNRILINSIRIISSCVAVFLLATHIVHALSSDTLVTINKVTTWESSPIITGEYDSRIDEDTLIVTIDNTPYPVSEHEKGHWAISAGVVRPLPIGTHIATVSAGGANNSVYYDYATITITRQDPAETSANCITNFSATNKSGSPTAVLKIQRFLSDMGYYMGEPNGVYDVNTLNAVAAFQDAEKVSTNYSNRGIFGPASAAAANRICKKANVASSVNSSVTATAVATPTHLLCLELPPMQRNDRSENVIMLQIYLSKLGYFSQTPNGVYGPATVEAVAAFQEKMGVITNVSNRGLFGPSTVIALRNLVCK